MVSRFNASLVLLLPLGCYSVAQSFHEVILGDSAVRFAEELAVPQNELWLLSEMGLDCFVLLNTGSQATVSISRRPDDNDPEMVFILVSSTGHEGDDEIMFNTKLPLILPQATLMTYEIGPNQRIVFRTAKP